LSVGATRSPAPDAQPAQRTRHATITGQHKLRCRFPARRSSSLESPPALAALPASALFLTGCGLFPNADTPSNSNADDDILGSPASDPDDDFQPLQIHMVAESGTFPDDVEGVTFGCSDTLVTINTVPTQAETAEEHVGDAIDFLLTDSQYYHGDPAVINSL